MHCSAISLKCFFFQKLMHKLLVLRFVGMSYFSALFHSANVCVIIKWDVSCFSNARHFVRSIAYTRHAARHSSIVTNRLTYCQICFCCVQIILQSSTAQFMSAATLFHHRGAACHRRGSANRTGHHWASRTNTAHWTPTHRRHHYWSLTNRARHSLVSTATALHAANFLNTSALIISHFAVTVDISIN